MAQGDSFSPLDQGLRMTNTNPFPLKAPRRLEGAQFSQMGSLFLLLQQMHNHILTGVPFAKDCRSCAALLDPAVLLPDTSAESGGSCETCLSSSASASPDSLVLKSYNNPDGLENTCRSVCRPRDLKLLQLTLIKMMLAKLQSPGVEVGLKQKYLDIFGVLLKEANIDSKLICIVCTSDKLLSHMASKSLVSLVLLQLREEGSLNSTWLSFCLETLSGFPNSSYVAECLWTLTYLIKEILKDGGLCTEGTLRKIFTPLDSILEGLYHSIMPHPDILQDALASAKVTNILSSFLDLLELLVASRIQAPMNLACQTLLFRDASGVLGLLTMPVHDLIKKKSILLLKRCILHKACEDLLGGKAPTTSLLHLSVEINSSALADTVLRFVNSGGLNQLSVSEKASHFGGTLERPDGAARSGSDQVVLRAVSLVLLKALEIKFQDSTFKAETEVHLETVMHPLLSFLKTSLSSSPCIHLFEHPCMWLSVLFIEQDDDMLEAAKALLTVYLKCERLQHESGFPLSSFDDGIWDTPTHRNGYNPHCIFLFLLESIAFDVSVLLDFLISSETCFLEYFVRYLKLLRGDWHHFVKISKHFHPSLNRDLSFSSSESKSGREHSTYRSDSRLLTSYKSKNYSFLCQVKNQAIMPNNSDTLRGPDDVSSLGALQRLAEYESSEDSETEWAGEEHLPAMKPTSLSQACKATTVHVNVGDQAQPLEEPTWLPEQKGLTVSSPSPSRVSPNNHGVAEGTLEKSLKCFQELQASISRLHGKNLFPYNPAALLKLLTHVNCISRQYRST